MKNGKHSPSYGDLGRPASHDLVKNFGTKNDFFGSESKNSQKKIMLSSENKEDKYFFGQGRACALPFSNVFSTPAWLGKGAT